MAKRYTDSQKFFKPWVQDLPQKYKLLWLYILDTCSISGIWDVSFKVPEAIFECEYNHEEAVGILKKQITPLSTKKWFINDFIAFQYKKLNPSSPPHQAVINELEEAGIWDTHKEKLTIKGVTENELKIPIKGNVHLDDVEGRNNIDLSEAEYKKLVDSYGKKTAEDCIAYLSSYKIEKGYKTKSDYLTILRWVYKAVTENKIKSGAAVNKSKTLNKGQSTDEVLDSWHK